MQPHEYPRRILFCVAGVTPQIITETLYALAVETEGRPAFVPTEVHVLTTSLGAERVKAALLDPGSDRFGALCREHGLQGVHFGPDTLHLIRDANGEPVADIRSVADNERAADAITRSIAELTRDSTAAVHVSIAGGRKTMGFYAGHALSLHGRAQDRLSHVLVDERFEQLRDFYYKPRQPITIRDQQGLEVSTQDARIQLADIPFVPLAHGLYQPLLDGRMGYAESVELLRRGSQEGVLVIDCGRGQISWQGSSLPMANSWLPIYLWFAHRRRSGVGDGWILRRDIAYDRVTHHDFIQCAQHYLDASDLGHLADAIEETFGSPGAGFDGGDWISPHLARLKRAIKQRFGPAALAQIGIEVDSRRKDPTRYRLSTPPELIRIEPGRHLA